MSHDDYLTQASRGRPSSGLPALARAALALLLALVAVPALAQYAYRRTITVDRTKVANPASLPIAFDNVTSAKTADAGASNLNWNHTIGTGADKIAIVSVSTASSGGPVTYDNSSSSDTGSGASQTPLTWTHTVGAAANRLAIVSVATRPAVVPDAFTSNNTGTGTATTLSWSHTVGSGSNRILIVAVAINRLGGSQTVNSVTYNSLALTYVGRASNGTNCDAELWYRLAPPTGSFTVQVTISAAARFVAGASSFANVNQAAPLNFIAGTGAVSPAAVNVTTGYDDYVVSVFGHVTATPVWNSSGTGQSTRWTNATTNGTDTNNMKGYGATQRAGTGATTTTQFTISTGGTSQWSLAAAALRPAVATFQSITFGGTDITANLIGSAVNSTNCAVYMYYMLNPTSGSNTVVVTLTTGSTGARFVAAATSYANVHQTTPMGTFVGANATGTTASVTVTSAANELVVDTLAQLSSTPTSAPTASTPTQDQRWADVTTSGTAAANIRGYGSTKAGATSTTMSWTISASTPWAVGAVPLKPAVAPVTITQVLFGATNITANLIGTTLNSGNCEVSMYYLKNPSAGSNTVSVTQSASTRFVAGAFSFFNVDQTTTFGTFASATDSGSSGDPLKIFSVSSANGEIAVGALAKRYNYTITAEAQNQQADRWNLWTSDATPANNILGIGSLRGGATSALFQWRLTDSTTQQLAFGGVSVKPTTAAAPSITTLSSYPLLVSLSDSTLMDAAHGGHVQHSSGYDIVFTASDGVTRLDHELEKYDGVSGQVVAWVRLPSVNGVGGGSDTQIYIYYGNPAITSPTQNKAAVWDANYMDVFHLAEAAGNATDSTSHGYVGNITNDPNVTRQAAKIGGGYHFGGASYIVANDGQFTSANAPLTIEAWFSLDTVPQAWVGIVTKNRDVQPCTASQPPCHWAGVATGNSGEMAYYWDWHTQGNQDTGPALSAATWYHAVLTFDGGIRTAYRNGVRDTNVTAPNPSPGTYDSLTMPTRLNQDMLGSTMGTDIIDEVRLSTVARPPGWFLTSYNNMNNPGNIGSPGFYTVGSEGPIALYRSVGINGANLNSGGPTVTISGTTATFSGAMPNNVGVGDVLTYTSGTAQLAFISGRTSSTVFTVQNKNGATPTAAPALTTVGVYRAYTSLANWQSQTENPLINEPVENDVNPSKNLVSTNTIMSVACYADGADPTAVTIDGWTTGTSYYIDIFAPNLPSEVGTTQRHNGTWDATKYRLVAALDYHGVIRISDEYVRVTGLQIENTGPKGNRPQGIEIDPGSATSEVRLSYNILRSTGTGTGDWWCAAIGQTNVGGIVKAWNNIMYSWGAGFFHDYTSSSSSVSLYNNTVVNSDNVGIDFGGHASGSYRLANNLVQGAATNFFFAAGVNLDYSATNLSQDATSPQPALRSKTVSFVDAGNKDYHLASGDTNAKDQGTTLSADSSLAFSDDIDAQGRPYGSAWDIGADEYGSGLFAYRRLITILDSMTPSGCAANLSNFPVLVSIVNDPELRTVTNGGHVQNANGYDIIFRASDEHTELDHEVESYVGVNGTLVAWVRIPTLTYNGPTTIYMYYGDPGISSPTANPTGVWNTAYGWRGVWHLNETPADNTTGAHKDSTSNANNGTPQDFQDGDGGSTYATGIAAGADLFAASGASDDRVEIGDSSTLEPSGDMTVEGWVKLNTFTTDSQVAYKRNTVSPYYSYQLYLNGTSTHRPGFQWTNGSGTTWDSQLSSGSLATGTWYHLVGVHDGTTLRLYVNGSDANTTTPTTTGSLFNSDSFLTIGAAWSGGYCPNGIIDEVRVSSVARNACWIGTEYNNQSTPGMVVVEGTGMTVKSGSYTGDAFDNKHITGLGFKPDIVIIKADALQDPVITTSSMPAYSSKRLGSTAAALVANNIKTLDTDGFTIGTDAQVNASSTAYYWVAFRAGAGELKVGSYQGTGVAHGITGVGFQPSWVVVLPSTANLARHRSASMPNTAYFHDQFSDSTGITSLDADGFSVDTDATVNTSGTTYHYFAFKKVSGKMNEGSYPGTGIAKSITGVGFQPEYVLVRTSTVTAGQRAVARPASLSGDSSLNFGIIANEPLHIQALLADGFQVGTSNRVNASPNTYHWVAFGPSGSIGSEKQAGPTAVELVSLDATTYPGRGVLISWRTGYEVDNLGFHVYREVGGERVQITPSLVAGSALVAGAGTVLTAGQSYSWWDPSPIPGASYWLEEWELSGERRWHGPVSVQPAEEGVSAQALSASSSGGSDQASSPLLSGLGQSASGSVEHRVRRKLRPMDTSLEARLGVQWGLAGRPAVKILVSEDGWYWVRQEELAAAGLGSDVDPGRLQLYMDGRQVPMVVDGGGDGRLGSGDGIEFYGLGLDTPTTGVRVYWLVAGSASGARVAEAAEGGSMAPGPASFPAEVERADRTVYVPAVLNGDESNFFGAVVTATPVVQVVRVVHVDTASPGELVVRLQGGTQGAHRVGVELNGVRVGVVSWEGMTVGEEVVPVGPGMILEGDNRVTLAAEGGEGDASVVISLGVRYAHTWEADADALEFTLGGYQGVTIGGFTSARVRVVDITDPWAVEILSGEVVKDTETYAVAVDVPEAGERTVLAVGTGGIRRPVGVVPNRPTAWHQAGAGADLVVIAHRSLLPALEPLRVLRESQGLKVALVDVESVFDEFSFGVKDPQAIKDFVACARASWAKPPRYLLLVGDASYDPRNYLFGYADLVPTKLVDTRYLETASDDWFADFDGDGIGDIAVGRIPVQSASEAATVTHKIVTYEGGPRFGRVLLLADANDEDNDFEGLSAQVKAVVPSKVYVSEVLRGQVGDAVAKSELTSELNHGQTLVNYLGHGSVDVWHANWLTAAEARALANYYFPFVVSMTCLNGYFHDPHQESLGEGLLEGPGGAVAVWASSGLTESAAQVPVDEALLRALFSGTTTLGDATRAAKTATPDMDIRRTWILLGDPSTKLR